MNGDYRDHAGVRLRPSELVVLEQLVRGSETPDALGRLMTAAALAEHGELSESTTRSAISTLIKRGLIADGGYTKRFGKLWEATDAGRTIWLDQCHTADPTYSDLTGRG